MNTAAVQALLDLLSDGHLHPRSDPLWRDLSMWETSRLIETECVAVADWTVAITDKGRGLREEGRALQLSREERRALRAERARLASAIDRIAFDNRRHNGALLGLILLAHETEDGAA